RRPRAAAVAEPPPVSELLSVDEEYRARAAAGELYKIAPKRFNPSGEAWLPVLHTRRDGRRYTALFSNTRLAHDLGKTGDWVVLYYSKPGEEEGQATVVTETQGDLAGLRVIRGREEETRRFYEAERALEL
ncbi:MAG: DNA-binding protein, partial [Anaerolineae bacterium]|nr:DNA-binding protein [Anaerolineae bacterium]